LRGKQQQLSQLCHHLRAPDRFFSSSSVLIRQFAAAMGDPRESSSYSVTPRIRYNTIGGVNGPLVILENVSTSYSGREE
jgi:hypothetical protein